MLNNPLTYVDPSGEEPVTAVIIIGAIIGMWQGGSIANGTMNPLEWDFSSPKTWSYMFFGAAVGAASAYVGMAVAASGIPMAGTASIVAASSTNSALTYMYTGGKTDFSVSFGVASYNFSKNEWGYLGKSGNSVFEDIGYGVGAFANISDIWSLSSGVFAKNVDVGSKDLITENDIVGHSASSDVGISDSKKLDINWGPKDLRASMKDIMRLKGVKSTNSYDFKGFANKNTLRVRVDNVRLDKYNAVVRYINQKAGVDKYHLIFKNCVTQVSRAFNAGGVFNIPLHPMFLEMQMFFRRNPFPAYLFIKK